jgi:ParB-like chromosome segregation protein Spo0J
VLDGSSCRASMEPHEPVAHPAVKNSSEPALSDRKKTTSIQVPVSSLKLSWSPRLSGENIEHTKLLLRVEDELPPILVHRQTMCVIDGLHRLRAAVLRGDKEIAVEFFHGDDDAAFIRSVQANVTHGLPLSLADRRAAAVRIIMWHPEWSNRAIASVAGLSADAVGGLRRSLPTGPNPVESRVGRDGRVRPADPSLGRRRAGELFAARPDASLREVAKAAGIALATARDVRERIRRGVDPVLTDRKGSKGKANRSANSGTLDNVGAILQGLKNDPSLRFNESGRRLLRWMELHAIGEDDKEWLADAVPTHCVQLVADLANGFAEAWRELAEELSQNSQRAAI